MKFRMIVTLVVIMAIVILPYALKPASAHVVQNFGNISVKVGLATEPPLVGDTNQIQITITQGSGNATQPLADTALDNMGETIKYGGTIKSLSFTPSDDTPGMYVATFIPSNLGSYFVLLKGSIHGQNIDASFPLDNVETKDSYLFPQSTVQGGVASSSGGSDNIGPKVNEIINQISGDINDVKTSTNATANTVLAVEKSYQELKDVTDKLYIISGVGIGVGIAGIVIAVFAINRSKRDK